jgi:hypothetical protein
MQTTQSISESQLDDVLASVFASGDPVVKEAYSDFDASTKVFPTLESLREDFHYTPGQKRKFFYYAIYYPAANGLVVEKRIELKPGAVKNHTHRFCQEGWGLVFLQITSKHPGAVECRVAVNSEKRANKWADTIDRFGDPDAWDWDVIKLHAGRLTRLLRKLGKQRAEQAEQAAAGQPATRSESK